MIAMMKYILIIIACYFLVFVYFRRMLGKRPGVKNPGLTQQILTWLMRQGAGNPSTQSSSQQKADNPKSKATSKGNVLYMKMQECPQCGAHYTVGEDTPMPYCSLDCKNKS